jgi:hypothetical protein
MHQLTGDKLRTRPVFRRAFLEPEHLFSGSAYPTIPCVSVLLYVVFTPALGCLRYDSRCNILQNLEAARNTGAAQEVLKLPDPESLTPPCNFD